MTRRLTIAGIAAAAVAAVLLAGGVLNEPSGAGPGSVVSPAVASSLESGFAAGDTRALVRRLEAGLRRHPDHARARTLLGLAYQQRWRETGDPAWLRRSEDSLRRAVQLDPAGGEAVAGLGAVALARHRFREALSLGRRAERLAPHSASAVGVSGDALLELGRYREAFAAFDRMVALRPGVASYSRISHARELLGKTRGAIEAMERAVDAAGPSGEARAWAVTQLGAILLDLGRLDAAGDRFREALAASPGFGPALAGLAGVAKARGRLAAAVRLYRRAFAARPDAGVAVDLGDVLAQLGRETEAERWYARALAAERGFAAAGGRNQLETALFDLDHDRRLADALVQAREGYRERPSIEGEHVLAWALYKNRLCGEARTHSIRALRLGTNDLDAIYHRALIERCLGNRSEAERFLARLRGLNPYYLLAPPSPAQAARG